MNISKDDLKRFGRIPIIDVTDAVSHKPLMSMNWLTLISRGEKSRVYSWGMFYASVGQDPHGFYMLVWHYKRDPTVLELSYLIQKLLPPARRYAIPLPPRSIVEMNEHLIEIWEAERAIQNYEGKFMPELREQMTAEELQICFARERVVNLQNRNRIVLLEKQLFKMGFDLSQFDAPPPAEKEKENE